MTAGALLQKLKARLPRERAHESYLILEHACGLSREALLFRRGDVLQEEQEACALACLARRLRGEPLQYIFGYSWFDGEKLWVEPGVLIPRQETELLAQLAVERILARGLEQPEVLDLCCGTGCIGLMVAKHTNARVTLGDLSEKALGLSRKNATLWGLSQRVAIERMDALKLPEGRRFDWIVSNPPYISEEEMKLLDGEVRGFEPRMALCGGADGLDFYKAITAAAPFLLREGGGLLFETGETQGAAVRALMTGFSAVEIHRDLCQKERIVEGISCIVSANIL